MNDPDEFYIGYEAAMPTGIARRTRVAVAVLGIVALGVAAVVTLAYRRLAESSFDYGHHQSWTGRLVAQPAPALLVPGPGGFRWFWLVGRGKHGADPMLASVGGDWATVTGTLISREGWRMIEVAAAAPVPAADGETRDLPPVAGGDEVVLDGEVVDSKCFLGVMNPGERTVHRDCAIRCLSGGVPPMFVYDTANGRRDLAVLVDVEGRLLHDEVGPLVGRALSARGRMFTINGQPVFQLASVTGRAQ